MCIYDRRGLLNVIAELRDRLAATPSPAIPANDEFAGDPLTVAEARSLLEAVARQLEERVAAGGPTEEGLVFVTEAGRPISAGWLSHRWPKIAAAAGLAGVTFHDLRHGQASLLVAAGVHPRVVQERLGHATVAMSMDVYSHVAGASDRDAADRLQEAIG